MDQGELEVSLRRNSTWTPKNHKPSREKVFEERLILLDKWYSGWNKEQRRTFLEHILMKCTIDQLLLIDSCVHPQLPKPPADFTRLFPRHLCLKIFSFLDPRSLCRATQVCWYWHYLTEENCIWKAKCLRFGWTLPSPPLSTDMGTWKRHYLSCVKHLHWIPPPLAKEEKEEILFTHIITSEHRDRPLPDNTIASNRNISSKDRSLSLPDTTMVRSRKKPTRRTNNKRKEGTFTFSRNESTHQDKPVWKHPDRFPKNLEQSTILTTSWLTSKHTRSNNYYPSLSTGNLHYTFSPSQENNEEQISPHDEVPLSDSETSQRVKNGAVFPRLSLPNNLSDRKTVAQVNRSEMYRSLLQRPGTSHDPITPSTADTTQQNAFTDKLSIYKNQSPSKDTEYTAVQLTTNPWPKPDYDSSDNDT